MYMQHHTAHHPKPFLHPALPLLLYNLGAANERLPSAVVLPEQLYSSPTIASKVPGEVALMYAVLEDALSCFQKQFIKSGRRAQRLAREAEEWFFADDYYWPFSFVNICAVLGLDPEYIRLGLKRWHQQPLAKPQKQRKGTVLVPQPLKTAA